ncbi:hypothetical protein [Azospirillum thermophilum]|uniref:Uncharacterized protein n=1 Tax=Azospirillum thermophilum TaxID=2202148 RepID=A0A2S2CS40_9PROT|nr:hypothetical protein [Azospirillum thermophilum]AWK87331.1 hypothetical protein DEW08_14870 [Azospirillum thermophilum]
MDLRVCFENKESVNVNDGEMMKHYARSYLADFDPEWGGFIMLPHAETRRKRMEPVWQVLIRNASPGTEQRLISYLDDNPMAAYFVHVYRRDHGNERKIH